MNQSSTKTARLRTQQDQLTTAQPTAECRLRNDRQSYFAITRELVQAQVQASVTADEVALLAQQLGYAVSGSDLLLLSGRSVDGVRVTRVDHPGEYPGRYY